MTDSRDEHQRNRSAFYADPALLLGRFTTRLTRLADAPATVVALDLFSSMLEAISTRVCPGAATGAGQR